MASTALLRERLVVPILICHGEKEWNIEPQFSALFDADETIKPFLLDFPFFVIDLGKIPDSELSEHPTLRASFMALKYAHSSKEEQLEIIFQIAEDLLEADREFLIKILRYLLVVYAIVNEEILRKMIQIVKPEKEMEWRSEFAQEIKRELTPQVEQDVISRLGPKLERAGMIKGEAKMLHRLLKEKFDSLPPWVPEKLSNATSQQLENWGKQIFTARSPEALFKEQNKH
ncbi:Rpn family recombination-promoting nuclease/putative transposase [Magnetococcales bacterium HHB-1]